MGRTRGESKAARSLKDGIVKSINQSAKNNSNFQIKSVRNFDARRVE